MLIDTFCHTVIQTLNQLLYISIHILCALSVLWLDGREKQGYEVTKQTTVCALLNDGSVSVCSNLD